ncbi:MAG: hypothetical protein FLDDKLPJ_03314 [Phycisphaerae bacterium]|nr:hypothetical protein [Phycisphaerae bacterium]
MNNKCLSLLPRRIVLKINLLVGIAVAVYGLCALIVDAPIQKYGFELNLAVSGSDSLDALRPEVDMAKIDSIEWNRKAVLGRLKGEVRIAVHKREHEGKLNLVMSPSYAFRTCKVDVASLTSELRTQLDDDPSSAHTINTLCSILPIALNIEHGYVMGNGVPQSELINPIRIRRLTPFPYVNKNVAVAYPVLAILYLILAFLMVMCVCIKRIGIKITFGVGQTLVALVIFSMQFVICSGFAPARAYSSGLVTVIVMGTAVAPLVLGVLIVWREREFHLVRGLGPST